MDLFDGVESNEMIEDKAGLIAYLNTVWQNRPLFLLEEGDEEIVRSTQQKFFKIENEKIQPKNYVGFVQYNGQRINVYPRVFKNHPTITGDVAPPAISHILKWISYASRIHFPFTQVPLQLTICDDWIEALIYLFSNHTLNTLSVSPYFTYQEVTEEMSFVRGRIALSEYINYNVATGRHHQIHCTYQPFLYDNLFNRIVKYTCRLLLSISNNPDNRRLLSDVLFLLDEVTDVYSTVEQCAQVSINRLYPEVDTIRNMCAAFLGNQIYSDGTSQNQNLCMLLPMELIFEQYIAGFILKNFPDLNAKSQASDEYVATTGSDFTKKVFHMKHDIMLPDKMIIDTKYKFRYANNDFKGGVSQQDMYQMITYCYKRYLHKGVLLYPHHFDKGANNEQNLFEVGSQLGNMQINACSIDMTEFDFDNFDTGQKMKLESILNNNSYIKNQA